MAYPFLPTSKMCSPFGQKIELERDKTCWFILALAISTAAVFAGVLVLMTVNSQNPRSHRWIYATGMAGFCLQSEQRMDKHKYLLNYVISY